MKTATLALLALAALTLPTPLALAAPVEIQPTRGAYSNDAILAVSLTGDAYTPQGVAVSGTGDATSYEGPAASGTGDARSYYGPALSPAGRAFSAKGPAAVGSGAAYSNSGPAFAVLGHSSSAQESAIGANTVSGSSYTYSGHATTVHGKTQAGGEGYTFVLWGYGERADYDYAWRTYACVPTQNYASDCTAYPYVVLYRAGTLASSTATWQYCAARSCHSNPWPSTQRPFAWNDWIFDPL